jgi:hypothetical protein
MGLRFYRRFRIVPGVRLNLGKRNVSISFGRVGSWLTFGTRGTRASVGVPGTGLYWVEERRRRRGRNAGHGLFWAIVVIGVIWFLAH